MKVLSLFDGMACGYEALQRAGIKIEQYYASEIDKYAIQIAKKNHPDIIEVGDVQNLWYEGDLLKSSEGRQQKNIRVAGVGPIDLLIGGSPCQGFSVAGKGLNFEDPRSKLFFEYVRLLNEVKPKYFLLENVKMKKEWQDIISRELGVEPIEINSSLVSAQNRRRLYRTNIPNVSQPTDKGIILKDILEENVDEKYYYSAERWNRILEGKYDIVKRLEDPGSKCNTLTTVGGGNHEKKIEDLISVRGGEILVRQATKQGYAIAHDGDGISLAYPNSTTRRGRVQHQKSDTLTTQGESHVILIPQTVRVRKYEVNIEKLKSELRNKKFVSHLSCKDISDKLGVPLTKVEHRFRLDDCFAIPDEDIWFRLKELLEINTDEFDKSITEFEEKPGNYEKAERKILPSGKMTTLTTSQNDDIVDYPRIRKLTPIEYERLQTLPDNYTAGVSDTQRYKMCGNGWTVDVIAHIFRFIPL